MKNKRHFSGQIVLIAISIFMMAISACNKQQPIQDDHGNHGNNQVHIFLTDDPAIIFDHVYLNIINVEIKAEDHDQEELEREHQGESDDNDHHGSSTGGWISLDMHPGIYDVLQFRNGLDTLMARGVFPTAHAVKKVRITLGTGNSVVFQGTTFPLTIKDEMNIVLVKLEDDFAPADFNGLLDFSLDFDAGRSIRLKDNKFEWQSDIRAFRKDKSGQIEGRVLPAGTVVLVTASNGVDTATATTEREGEFRIAGLKPGTYNVVMHAIAGNFQDTVIQNVVVSEQEDTHMSNVTLTP